MARPTRVMYVENDPTLRGIIARSLEASAEIELVSSYASSNEALEDPDLLKIDVALLDLALGADSLNGTELGIAIRTKNPNAGIVIFTQHMVPDFLAQLPEEFQWGWSCIEKRADLENQYLVDVLRATARGLNVVDPKMQIARATVETSPIDRLSVRQREVMALAATGLDAPAIAESLSIAAVTVRQDLSKAYAILIPNPKPGTDLRTSAVLKYLKETRLYTDEFQI